MKAYKIMFALSAVTMMFSQMAIAQQVAPIAPATAYTWEMTSIVAQLNPNQVEFLNTYMKFPNAPEMTKMNRATKAKLPLYIAVHANQLDPSSLELFRVNQLLNSGMSLEEVSTLNSVMRELYEGRNLDPDQNEFLREFITTNIKKMPAIALDYSLQPLFLYVKNTPDEFNAKTATVLREALLNDVGLTSSEVSRLVSFTGPKSEGMALQDSDIRALNKVILIAYLQGLEVFEAQKLLGFQSLIFQNIHKFNPQLVQGFNWYVENGQSVQNFKRQNVQDNSRRMVGLEEGVAVPEANQQQQFQRQQQQQFVRPQQQLQFVPHSMQQVPSGPMQR